jgi:hypothetical protein
MGSSFLLERFSPQHFTFQSVREEELLKGAPGNMAAYDERLVPPFVQNHDQYPL